MDTRGIIYAMNVIERPQFCLKHAAHMVGVSDKTVRRWIKAGKVNGWQVGGRRAWYLDLEQINEMRNAYGLPQLSNEQAVEIHKQY